MKPFRPVERLDVGWELATSQEARKRLNNLAAHDPLLELARGSWYSEAEALAVAERLTEALFGHLPAKYGYKGTDGYV